ncbi:MAG: hypothetical protein ABIG64_02640 [Candidatus Omnitrophota bacterium]
MKKIIKPLLILVILFLLVYSGMAQKAHKVKEVRMRFKLQEKEISEKEYNEFIKNHTFINTLLDPKSVLNVD